MTTKEFTALRKWELLTKRFAPRRFNSNVPSRRSTKSQGQAVGQVLKRSTIRSEVGLETIYNHPAWK